MNQAIQTRQSLRLSKNLRRQKAPVDTPIRGQDSWSKLGDHRIVRLTARFQHLMPEFIGMNQVTPKPRQFLPDIRLSTGQPAREPDLQHVPIRRSAEATVFVIN